MAEQLPLRLQLKASARFSNFIAGPNAELIGQLRQVASGQGEAFFFCWGGAGCGKTHLLQACCHQAASEGRTVAYVSLRDAAGLSPALLEGWEQFNLVCLDDVDAISSEHRDAVETYNREDCLSTWSLRSWLEGIRDGLVDEGTSVPRPVPGGGDPPEDLDERQRRILALFELLTLDVPPDPESRDREQEARWLLAERRY